MTDLRQLLKTIALALALVTGPALAATPEVVAVAAAVPAASPAPSLPSAFDDPLDVPMPDADLWHRIRVGFLLEPLDSPLVTEHESWYSSRPEYIKRFVDRGSLYLHHIVEQVEKRRMPMEIALLPVIESAFTPRANSRAKASGLWQFIPSTGKNYGLTQTWWKDNRRDVVAATDAALNYLQRLHDMFGSWELALAAYNCGEGCVGRAIAYNEKRGLPTDFLSLKLPPETRNYVPKLIAVKNIVLSPGTYGIELDSVADQPYFTTVEAPAKIDVKLAAKLAGMTEEEFVALNPAYNKPVAIASAGTGTLVLPLDKAEAFKANLEAYDKPLVSWTTYNAKRYESIDAIAKRHGVSPAQLRAANEGLKMDKKGRLRAAAPVMVPMRAGAASVIVAIAPAKAHPAHMASLSIPTASAAASPRPAAPAAAGRTYTVRAGDTLYAIAQRFNTAVDTLLALNKLSVPSVIQPGLRLKLP
ncbi:MAG: transglycosylase SLT domain-containing protein [Usitatibacter sp.]